MNKVNAFTNNTNNFLISYSGAIDSQAISTLIEEAEEKIYSLNLSADLKKRIMGIMIELLQNILYHCPLKALENNTHTHSFLVEKKRNGFIITASNPMHKSKIAALKNRIENLNSATSEELKSQYQNQLKNGTLINEHAGLGLIDVIRKSGNPILFKFASGDNNYSLFTVKALIQILT